MDEQNRNLILATVLSFLVIVVWFYFFAPPPTDPALTPPETTTAIQNDASTGTTGAGVAAGTPESGAEAEDAADVAEISAPRVTIDTARVKGSISLLGARIDDLSLKGYRETVDPASPIVRLLIPSRETGSLYSQYGWFPVEGVALDDLPGRSTLWSLTDGDVLGVGKPVTLSWTNSRGLTFHRVISVDENFLFTVSQQVENNGSVDVQLYPYGAVVRRGLPSGIKNFFILHEGVVQMTDGVLDEVKYKDLAETAPVPAEGNAATMTSQVASDGWIGFTDHYWQTVLAPMPGQAFTAVAKHIAADDIYRTEVRLPAVTLKPGEKAEATIRLFAGAKEWATIREYEKQGIAGFIESIDWGWFYFLTKPMFALLHWLHGVIGNMGWAIIALTFIIKLLVFPLARKSYISMARMKELQPEMEKLKETAGEDRQKFQRGMMELYKREKVNPAAGCLPILIQIPIFFSLYKVIFVTLELRHAPWVGYLNDLSAPDPSSLYNFFGLLPWAAPAPGSILALIFIGIMPIILGISMWLQQKLNPAPTDPTQAAIFAWMPWIFMFMLGGFASGLVLYWITNNIITFAQQYTIMSMHGKRPDLFDNIRAGLRRKKPDTPAK